MDGRRNERPKVTAVTFKQNPPSGTMTPSILSRKRRVRMKIIIAIGMVVIFISAFFMLFIFDTVVKDHIRCMIGVEDGICNLRDTGTSLAIGLSLITIFLIIDSAVLYIIFRTVTSSGSSYVSYSARPYP